LSFPTFKTSFDIEEEENNDIKEEEKEKVNFFL
jgi:hypothetical protein